MMPDHAANPDATVADEIDDVVGRVQGGVGRFLFAARYIVAPLYIGMLAVLALVVFKFFQKLYATGLVIQDLDSTDTILMTLQLVDLCLLANLILIVIFAGWDNFVGPLRRRSGRHDRLATMYRADFGEMKLKLIASIAAIACIQILETFIHLEKVSATIAMWQVGILIAVGVTSVLLALTDKLSHR